MLVSTTSFQVVPLRVPEGTIVYIKHLESAWVFRIMPIRDPDQHRLWCFRIEACADASLSARTASFDPYYTSLGMTREQQAANLDALRNQTHDWLGHDDQKALRIWLGNVVRQPIPQSFQAPVAPSRSQPVVVRRPDLPGL